MPNSARYHLTRTYGTDLDAFTPRAKRGRVERVFSVCLIQLTGFELVPAERGVPRLDVDLPEVLEYRRDVLRGQYLALCAGRGIRPLQLCDGIKAMFGVLQHGESKLGGPEEGPQCEYVRGVLHQGVPEELQIPF
eukprot:3592487-Prymnesium_polylepis.2